MKSANFWLWLFVLLSGLVLGGFIGDVIGANPTLSWLGYGYEFGLTEPLELDCYILKLTFAVTVRINIASVLGVFLSMLMYKLFRK